MLTHGKKLRPFREYFGESEIPWETRAKIVCNIELKLWTIFIHLWRKQYRPSLQQRAKWFTKQPNIKVGRSCSSTWRQDKKRILEISKSHRNPSLKRRKCKEGWRFNSLALMMREGNITHYSWKKRASTLSVRVSGWWGNETRMKILFNRPQNDQDVAWKYTKIQLYH